ncbi:MAG: phosphorylase [Synechococcales cyanobacterium RM1_1_8]|nr:phosphorylase [Synechococcales cyanobacterium RM1_1_8]
MFDRILVPQGAEAAAVRRGLQRAEASTAILPIAMGPEATVERLTTALSPGDWSEVQRVLVLGVAGSLSPQLGVGEVVVYGELLTSIPRSVPLAISTTAVAQLCEPGLWERLVQSRQTRLPRVRVSRVRALSCDRLIHKASEKAQLYDQTGAAVVDMEAAAIAQCLTPYGIQITTVRVISDDAGADLPDLAGVVRADGGLDSGKLAIALARQPQAAFRLIRGSLGALKVLQQVTQDLLRPQPRTAP